MGNTVGSRKNLTPTHRSVIVGSLLGDGCMERNGRYVRLKIGHGLSQKPYVNYKFRYLKALTSHQPRFVEGVIHKTAKKQYSRIEFLTLSLPSLEEYWQKFYHAGAKRIPRDISEYFTDPLALAIWFMDDGCKRNDCNALRISTDSFSLPEQKILQRCLLMNFRIVTKIHRKGKFWNLYVPSGEAKKFCGIVKPFIIPSMKYKISLDPVTTDPVRER